MLKRWLGSRDLPGKLPVKVLLCETPKLARKQISSCRLK